MFYIFLLNLVRLSFNVSPEDKYLDTNIFNINSNENTVMYIFALNMKILSESHLDIFLQQFSKRGKREIFMLSLGRVRNESFNFYLGLKNSVIKLSCVYLFKSLFYLKKFCLNEDKISTLICIFREVVIIF